MLEVLCSGLYSVDDMRGCKLLAVETRYADEQTLHERELGGEEREFPGHARHCAGENAFFSIGKLAAKDGVDEEVFHDVRMTVEEGLIAAIVRLRVLRSEGLKSRARPVANAVGERFDALDESRAHVAESRSAAIPVSSFPCSLPGSLVGDLCSRRWLGPSVPSLSRGCQRGSTTHPMCHEG